MFIEKDQYFTNFFPTVLNVVCRQITHIHQICVFLGRLQKRPQRQITIICFDQVSVVCFGARQR